MTTLYLHAGREGPAWQERFERAAPEWRVLAWPAEVDRAKVDFIACWRPPSGFFHFRGHAQHLPHRRDASLAIP